MLNIERTGQFKKDYKRKSKQIDDFSEFETVLRYLVNEEQLPKKYLDHSLNNCRQYMDARECHIQPDWLLIYRIKKKESVLRLIRTGSHSDLF